MYFYKVYTSNSVEYVRTTQKLNNEKCCPSYLLEQLIEENNSYEGEF